jgi:hypothetical protein
MTVTYQYRMKNFFCLVCLLLTMCSKQQAQTFTDSNLPIVVINMDGGSPIPDQPRAKGTMKIIYAGSGQRNFLSDQNNTAMLNYNGRIEIESRGSSSQALEKKQYGLTTLMADNTTNNNVSLLGMPKENDWVLNGLAFDASLMRDYISYNLSRTIGQYAPRTQYCEVIINGDYRGLYVLQEKIKADDNRVDVVKLATGDNTLPDLSGGYITKADKVTSEDPSAWKMENTDFIHEMPKPSQVTTQQNNYIRSLFYLLNEKGWSNNITGGYPSIIDVPSFIDFMIINELAANVDAYQFSTYFHKDRNAKLRAGPLWDLNLTYGNDLTMWGLDRSKTNLWQFDNGDNIGPKFWRDLFNNTTFKCYLAKRWNALTQSGAPLNLSSLEIYIDETTALISEAAVRENARWGTVDDHAAEISEMKSWLSARITWMTNNLGSFAACSNVETPPLVITKIHYRPVATTAFPESSDQEFIEIVNNGNEVVDLTGIYFSGTGFVYQFEAGSSLEPGDVIQLANNRTVFDQVFGYIPYDEFTRSLSNTGQKLTLADAYGNIIDEVEYSNLAPWPNADGNGSYLKLKSIELDNGLAINWETSTAPIVSTVVGLEEATVDIEIFPNPSEDLVRLSTSHTINKVQLLDAQGRLLENIQAGSTSAIISLGRYARGMYLLMVTIGNKSVVRKLIKK